MGFLSIDSPIMRFLGKIADLMIVNVLTIICSIPIFTIGPALTAAHYVCLKIVRKEEGYVIKNYFKAFKENFKQATVIWLILLAIMLILVGDYYIMTKSGLEFHRAFKIVIIVAAVLVVFMTLIVFPIQAKFANPVKTTLKNAFLLAVAQIPKMVIMAILYVTPVCIAAFYYQIIPLLMVLGLSLPMYLSAMMYNKIFLKLEGNIQKAKEEEEGPEEEDPDRIFSDELDEKLIEEYMDPK